MEKKGETRLVITPSTLQYGSQNDYERLISPLLWIEFVTDEDREREATPESESKKNIYI